MKIVRHAVIVLVSAGIGLAAGYAWKYRTNLNSVANGEHAAKTLQAGAAQPSRKEKAKKNFDDSPLTTQLARDLASSSAVRKWFYWMTALEHAQPADFPRLLKLAHGNPAVRRAVINRWVETAPRHLFDTLVAQSKSSSGPELGELGRALFQDWPKRDPEAAIAALNTADNLGMRDIWRHEVASTVVENNAERGIELFSQWHIENYGPNMNAITPWAAADPLHAAQFILAHPSGFISEMSMEAAGKAWAATDPAAALAFATSQPGDLSSKLANTVVKEWAARNLGEASDWIAGSDDRVRSRLSPLLVEAWAKQDAPGALSWSLENLQGTQLIQAVTGVMNGAAQKDATAAAAMVTAMEPSQMRAEAAAVVAGKLFPQFDSTTPVKPETLAWLAGLDHQSAKQALQQVSWQWSTADPKSMAQFLSAASSDEVPPYVDSILARQLARTTPNAALDWAATLPPERGLRAGGDAFADWQQGQPEAALQWLNNLSATDPRRQPFFESMVHTLAYDSQGMARLAAMSPSDQAAAQTIISSMSLPEDKRASLLSSLKPH